MQSEVALLKTDKADTGSAFGAKEVADLPLSDFRNYQSLLDLVPGSTPSEFQNAEIDTPARALATTVNGTNPNTNSTRVDGATNQFTWLPHHTLYVAPAETIATVNVTTGSFSADQGLAGGAAVTVTTKSGTNQLRGSVFGFYTDQNLRAQTYFAKRNGTPKLPTNHHIDGGTLGGPIVKNKLFYFGAFEGQYRNTAGETIYDVPTEKMRRGDFSEALNNNGSLQLIYDPRTGDVGRTRTYGVCRQRHPGGSHQRHRQAHQRVLPAAERTRELRQLLQGIHQHLRPQSVRREDQLEPESRPSDLGKVRRDGRDGEQPAEALVRRRRPREDADPGRDHRPDLHAEPIARHRHDRRLLAARPVGVRPGLRHQLRPRARRARHERPGHPAERHAGLGQRHERAGIDGQLESLHAVRSDLHGGRQRHEAGRRALVPVRRGRSTSRR